MSDRVVVELRAKLDELESSGTPVCDQVDVSDWLFAHTEELLAECERLRAALRGYHNLIPTLADCANECGEALLYADVKRANDRAAAALGEAVTKNADLPITEKGPATLERPGP